MTKLILALVLFTGLWADKYPKDVTGKWVVDTVDPGDAINKIPADRREMVVMMAKEMMKTAVFEFKADHTCNIVASMPNIPKDAKWEYDLKTGIVKVTGADPNGRPGTMLMNVVEKNGKTMITIQKTPVVLTVHKKA